jgi:hypothetical protein
VNSQATAAAIAATFSGVTATDVNGIVYPISVGPTASLPNSFGNGPALLVFPPSATLALELGHRRADELDFPVRLLSDPFDYPTRSNALYAWYDALRDRVETNFDLDLAYVAWAQPVTARVELDGWTYAGVAYDLVEIIVRVHYNEIVATVHI